MQCVYMKSCCNNLEGTAKKSFHVHSRITGCCFVLQIFQNDILQVGVQDRELRTDRVSLNLAS